MCCAIGWIPMFYERGAHQKHYGTYSNISKSHPRSPWIMEKFHDWLVVSNIFLISIMHGIILPINKLIFFKMVFAPPTRLLLTIVNHIITIYYPYNINSILSTYYDGLPFLIIHQPDENRHFQSPGWAVPKPGPCTGTWPAPPWRRSSRPCRATAVAIWTQRRLARGVPTYGGSKCSKGGKDFCAMVKL